jgi:anti-sigma B factor antagonist
MSLKIDTQVVDGVTVAICNGRIVFGEESTYLRQTLKDVMTTTKQVVLDLSSVSYIDSGGLGMLVGVYSSARAAGADIKLTGIGSRLKDVLQITKLVTVFEIYDTVKQAVAAFSGRA